MEMFGYINKMFHKNVTGAYYQAAEFSKRH